MNGMDIYAAVGEADERFVAEAMTKTDAETRCARRLWKPFAAAAAAVLGVIAVSSAVFAAKPALAAEIPGVSRLVYAAAPERTATEADRERLEALLNEAFGALAFNDYETASGCFRGGLGERGNYLAAAYIDHLLAHSDMFPDGSEAGELEIKELDAERKAYRYTARVTLDLVSRDGRRADAEECAVSVWENSKGMYIESIEFGSKAFSAYAAEYENTFGPVPESGASPEMIPLDNGYMSYVRVIAAREGARQREDRLNHMIAQLDSLKAPKSDKEARLALLRTELERAAAEITPEVVTAEELASELMYRYWLGMKTGETGDLSDIMERNETTDLFFYDALLTAERVSLGVLQPLVTVEKGSAEMLEIIEETDNTLKARFLVQTETSDGVSQDVGEEIILTLRKTDPGFIIIGFDREVGDGLYLYSLKPMAERLKAEGCSWQDAGRMAYEEAHAQLIRDAEWLQQHGY